MNIDKQPKKQVTRVDFKNNKVLSSIDRVKGKNPIFKRIGKHAHKLDSEVLDIIADNRVSWEAHRFKEKEKYNELLEKEKGLIESADPQDDEHYIYDQGYVYGYREWVKALRHTINNDEFLIESLKDLNAPRVSNIDETYSNINVVEAASNIAEKEVHREMQWKGLIEENWETRYTEEVQDLFNEKYWEALEMLQGCSVALEEVTSLWEDDGRDDEIGVDNEILEYSHELIDRFDDHFNWKNLYDWVCHFTFDKDTNEFEVVDTFSDGQPNFSEVVMSHNDLTKEEKGLNEDILYMTFLHKVNTKLEKIK